LLCDPVSSLLWCLGFWIVEFGVVALCCSIDAFGIGFALVVRWVFV